METLANQMRQAKLTDKDLLEEFVVDNIELEQLEEKLRQFNIFEAVGMQYQEIRHSAFLAFLLDPQQTHGLGEDFLKKVLQRAVLGTKSASHPVDAVKLHLMNLTKTTVKREWSKIDVLLLNEHYHLAVIIENKLQSGEHDNQLDRYYQRVQQEYPTWRILALYLTIDGTLPSHSHYLPISFTDIADIVDNLVKSRETILGPDVRILMQHYVQMLRRNIVSDAELDELCHQIYQKHKRAIDLIITRMPSKDPQVIGACRSVIESHTEFKVRYLSKRQIGFYPLMWDVPALRFSLSAAVSHRLILEFYFIYDADESLRLALYAEPDQLEIYNKLIALTQQHPELFLKVTPQGDKKSSRRIYSVTLLSAKDVRACDISMLHSAISQPFDQFLQGDYLQIQTLIAQTIGLDTYERSPVDDASMNNDIDLPKE